MNGEIYVWDDMAQAVVPKSARRGNRPNNRNPDLGCPSVVTDVMDPVKSMLDGKMYDSKSHLRETYRVGGVTEVGNDPSIMAPKPFVKPKPDRLGIQEAVTRAYSAVDLVTPG